MTLAQLLVFLLIITQCQYLLVSSTSMWDDPVSTFDEVSGEERNIHNRHMMDSNSKKKSTTKSLKNKSKSCKQDIYDIVALISSTESLSDPCTPQRKALDWLLSEDTIVGCQVSSMRKSAKGKGMRRIKSTKTQGKVVSSPAALNLTRGIERPNKSLKKSTHKNNIIDSSSSKDNNPSSPSFNPKSPNSKSMESNDVGTVISLSSSNSDSIKSLKKKSKSKSSGTSKSTKKTSATNKTPSSGKSTKGAKSAFNDIKTTKNSATPSPQPASIWGPSSNGANNVPIDQDAIIQRYTLAVFYFSTNGDDTWERCGRNSKMPCDLIGAGQRCVNGPKSPWLSASHECNWGGLECKHSKWIHRIDFVSNSVSGSLPSELASLSRSLKVLNLEGAMNVNEYWRAEHEYLSGTIPSELGELSNLKALNLNFNNLVGTLPPELFKLTNLIQLDLNENYLSSTIPMDIGDLANLRYLQLESNRLEGALPEELGQLKDLEVVTLWNNSLSGTVPSELCSLRRDFKSPHGVGVLDILEADCFGTESILVCGCCSRCVEGSMSS